MKSPFIHLTIWGLLSAAVLSGYVYWYHVVSSESLVVAGLQNQIDTKKETVARVASARATLAQIAGDESVIRNYFVPETGVVSFIDDLEERAEVLNASLKVGSVSMTGGNKLPTLVFSLSIEGSFDAVMRTLGAIEYAPYNLVVSKFSTGDNGKNIWHADLEVQVGSVPTSTATSSQQTSPKPLSLSYTP